MCLAIPVRITAIHDDRRATAEVGGIVREIDVSLVAPLAVGDHVILHVGVALARIDRDAAQRTLEAMRSAGTLEETLDALR